MKFLVIGASSFTGSHFCQYVRSKGHKAVEQSLRDFMPYLADQADYVVNFAALNVVAPSWRYPEKYADVNITQQIKVMEWLKDKPIKKYVHVSTPEVYGSTNGLVTESERFNPSTPYAASRAAFEFLLGCYHRQYGFPSVVTRSSNVYGPCQQLYRLIPKLIVSIKKGIKFPLEGKGFSTRSFIHVLDACTGIYLVATEGEVGTAYHISSPIVWTISGLVGQICQRMGVDFNDAVEFVPERQGKDAAYRLDDRRIRALGWDDSIDMRQGLDEVIAWIERDWDKLKDQPLEYRL